MYGCYYNARLSHRLFLPFALTACVVHDQREMHVLMQKEQQAISEFHKLLLSKQSKVQLKIFLVKMSFICIRLENSFHSNGFALSLTLKQSHAWSS